jgi:hypothetical protein
MHALILTNTPQQISLVDKTDSPPFTASSFSLHPSDEYTFLSIKRHTSVPVRERPFRTDRSLLEEQQAFLRGYMSS